MKPIYATVLSLLALLAVGSAVIDDLPLEISVKNEVLSSLRTSRLEVGFSNLQGLRVAKLSQVLPQVDALNKASTHAEVLSLLNSTNLSIAERIFRGKTPNADVSARTPLLVMVRPGSTSVCTGSLLTRRWVLTAAHCLTYRVGSSLRAVNAVYARTNGVWARATSMNLARQYVRGVVREDIALVRLGGSGAPETSATFSIARSATSPAAAGSIVGIAGYGQTGTAGGTRLVQGSTAISTSGVCAGTSRFGYLCTATAAPASITCRGDSGGPLFTGGGRSLTVLGVTRGGIYPRGLFNGPPPCGDERVAPVYVDVRRWANDLILCTNGICQPNIWVSVRL